MAGAIILVIVGILLFKLAAGLGTLFDLAIKIIGVLIIIGAVFIVCYNSGRSYRTRKKARQYAGDM